jgi:hypothetical protein
MNVALIGRMQKIVSDTSKAVMAGFTLKIDLRII